MNQYFHVGEVAILQNCTTFPQLNDVECIITRGLQIQQIYNKGILSDLYCYNINLLNPDGSTCAPLPHNLRKKFDGGSWDDCLFKPKEKENV